MFEFWNLSAMKNQTWILDEHILQMDFFISREIHETSNLKVKAFIVFI